MEQDPLFFVKKYKYYSWIIGLGLLVYANSLFNGFIWDDKTYIINNPEVHKLTLNLLFGRNWFNSAGFYRPIPALYFAILYNLFGNTSFFYHIIQVGVHIGNAVLVFVLFKKFFNNNLAFIFSLIFLVHPVNTESVGYIASSDNVLFFFFGIIALLLSWQKKVSIKKVVLIFFLLLLSLMTKETGILFLVLVFISRWLFHKRSYIVYGIGSVVTVFVYTVLRIHVIGTAYARQNTVPIMQLSLVQRVLHIPLIIFYYLKTFFFPVSLAVSQNWTLPSITFQNFYLPLVGEIVLCFAILGGVFLVKKNIVLFIFFFLWFVFGLGMLLQIVPLDMTVADRWFYFPMIGILGGVGVFYERSVHIKNKQVLFTVAVILVGLLSIRTIFRNANWVDAETLYSHDIVVSDDYNKEDGLAAELIAVGKFNEALPHAEQSIRLHTNFANVNDLGVIYQHLGDFKKAEKYYQESIALHPGTISPYLNLASLYALHSNNPELAVPIIKNILLKQYPNISRFWLLLAVVQYRKGESEDALHSAQKAYALSASLQTQYLLDFIENKLPVENLDTKKLE